MTVVMKTAFIVRINDWTSPLTLCRKLLENIKNKKVRMQVEKWSGKTKKEWLFRRTIVFFKSLKRITCQVCNLIWLSRIHPPDGQAKGRMCSQQAALGIAWPLSGHSLPVFITASNLKAKRNTLQSCHLCHCIVCPPEGTIQPPYWQQPADLSRLGQSKWWNTTNFREICLFCVSERGKNTSANMSVY